MLRRQDASYILCTELGIDWDSNEELLVQDESENQEAALAIQVSRIWHQGKVLRVTFRDDESGFSPEEYKEVKYAIINYANTSREHFFLFYRRSVQRWLCSNCFRSRSI